MEITAQNAPDLLILCDEFQLTSCRRSIEQFACSQGGNYLISSLLVLSREGRSTSSLETALNSRFPDFAGLLDSLDSVESTDLATLPLPILSRIVKFPHPTQEEAFRRVFEFCLRVFDLVGPNGSILFRTLDLRHLGRNYLRSLRVRPTFDWSFIDSSFCDTLFDCQSHYESLLSTQKQLEEDSDKMCAIISDLESRLKSIDNCQRSFGLKTDIDDLISRMNSLISTSASKSEFDSLKSNVSEIQREFELFRPICALKEEVDSLRSSSVVKTEWNSFVTNYATKKDLESLKSVSVKQSDCESLRQSLTSQSDFNSFRAATQAELASLKQEAATKTELNSLRTAAARKSQLDGLGSTFVSKAELNSMKSDWAAKSDLDLVKRELATKTELSAMRNVLDSLVADVDRVKRSIGQWSFRMNENGSLDGIIASLTRRFGGNVHDRGIVTISASSLLGPEYSAQNAADLNCGYLFSSDFGSDSWLCYDFKARRVKLTQYSMKRASNHVPKSWVLEGSLNGTSWMQLDERMNTADLNGWHGVASFPVSTVAKSRFIRLRLIAPNHSGWSLFCIYAVEFFGTLIE
jgi:hypothetical protein